MNDEPLRILFINYPCPRNSNTAPLLSFGYLGTIAEDLGVKVHILDANFYLKPYSAKEILDEVNNIKPHLIGMTLFTQTVIYGYDLLKELKSAYPQALYVAGGPHATILPEETLKYGFNIACRGEGERTIAGLIKHLKGELDLSQIKGISYYEAKDRFVSQPDVEQETDLDRLPIVDYDLFDPLYFSKKNLDNEFAIFTSRGCPNKCTYCNSYGVFGEKYRYRSSDNILKEIELLNKKYGVKRISFVDDYFTLNSKRMLEVCEGLLKRDIKIEWQAYSKAGAIPRKNFVLLKASGCVNIAYGIENVYPKTLELINKKTSLNAIKETYKNTNYAGFDFKTNIMAGFPWETKESVKTNIDFILKHKRSSSRARFNLPLLYPIPSTKLYNDNVEKFPKIKETWLKMDVMEMLSNNEDYFKVNLFDLDHKVIDEIKFMAYVIFGLQPLRQVMFWKRALIFPFKRLIYSYFFLKIFYRLYGHKIDFACKV